MINKLRVISERKVTRQVRLNQNKPPVIAPQVLATSIPILVLIYRV